MLFKWNNNQHAGFARGNRKKKLREKGCIKSGTYNEEDNAQRMFYDGHVGIQTMRYCSKV